MNMEKLIYKLSWKFSRTTGIPFEDLVSEATVAWLSAAERFDPAKGAPSTYAYHVIHNHLASLAQVSLRETTIDDEEKMESTFSSIPSRRPSPHHELEFRQLVLSMSKEAQEVCSILFHAPEELSKLAKNDMPKSIRGALKGSLRSRGWSWPKIWKTFEEIKTALA